MATPLRFLHTADWQLGLKLAFVAGDAGAVARFQKQNGLDIDGVVDAATRRRLGLTGEPGRQTYLIDSGASSSASSPGTWWLLNTNLR